MRKSNADALECWVIIETTHHNRLHRSGCHHIRETSVVHERIEDRCAYDMFWNGTGYDSECGTCCPEFKMDWSA